MGITLAADLRNDIAAAILARIDAGAAGTIELRTGAKPATPNDAATGTLIATFTLTDPAGTVAGPVLTFDFDPDIEAVAANAGDPGWARVKDSTGAAVLDGTAGVAGSGPGGSNPDFTTNVSTVTAGQTVRLLNGTVTAPL
jgi:hypothetical protein